MTAVWIIEGVEYSWDGRNWTDSDGIIPPAAVRHRLNREAAEVMDAYDVLHTEESQLTREAQKAADDGNFTRAIALSTRALELSPRNEGRAATAVSVLRKASQSGQALSILRQFRRATFAPLLTTGAAVLCDLGRWEDAKAVLSRVVESDRGDETWAVWHRIRSVRPDLF